MVRTGHVHRVRNLHVLLRPSADERRAHKREPRPTTARRHRRLRPPSAREEEVRGLGNVRRLASATDKLQGTGRDSRRLAAGTRRTGTSTYHRQLKSTSLSHRSDIMTVCATLPATF